MVWRREVIVGVAVMVVAGIVRGARTQQGITVTSNAYSGVVVAIRDDLNMTQCPAYVDSIKAAVESASSLLLEATGNKLYFGDVSIVVPAAWDTCGEQIIDSSVEGIGWEDAHVRVGPKHLLFGDNPWTQQPRGCGQPGDFIYVSDTFLSDSSLGSQGKLLVHEWAKFRWGVFEEYGHLHDPIYPSAYRVNRTTFEANYCANGKISGDIGDDCTESSLEENCSFNPDELDGNGTATSSLLAAPFLSTVVEFCDSSDHNTAAPTKHNLLCDRRSTLDVINQHSDMNQAAASAVKNTTFTVVKASPHRETLVFLLDYSATMREVKGRWEFLRDSFRQFIMAEASPEIQVGVVVFADAVYNSTGLLTLDTPANRKKVADAALVEVTSENTKNLQLAIEKGVQTLNGVNGELVLVTENLKQYQISQDLVGAAKGNPIWPILYPSDPTLSTEIYQELANIAPTTSVLTVNSALDNVDVGLDTVFYQAVENYATLTKHLLYTGKKTYEEVASDICSEDKCNITLPVKNSTKYEAEFFIEVLYSSFEKPGDVVIKVPGLEYENAEETSRVFTSNQLQNEDYIVTIERTFQATPVIVSLVATPKSNYNLKLLVWSSQELNNMQFAADSVPVLFTMVTKAWRHVVYADVTAVIDKDEQTITLKLQDNGVGGDVTGNDGVYSAYMVGLSPPGDVSIIVMATDNNSTARLLGHATRGAPVNPADYACCGSQLNLPENLLEDPGAFSVLSPDLKGRLIGEQPDSLPPSQITDLKSSQDGYKVTLSFTAPGDQLDQGTAASYKVQYQAVGDSIVNDIANMTGTEAGSLVNIIITLPDCDIMYIFTVTTIGTLGSLSKVSNEVREFVSCTTTASSTLSAGAIAGIVIGSLLGVIIIIIIVYLCLNSDHLDDLWLWQMLTCKRIRGEKDEVYNSPPPPSARRNDVIRRNTGTSGPIFNISDLYAKPNLEAKKNARRKKQEEEDDGGFSEHDHRRQNENLQMNARSDSSQRSSLSSCDAYKTMPINQVGLPPAVDPPNYGPPLNSAKIHGESHDNYGYEGSGSDDYGSRHPQPRNPRINTQV